MKHAHLGSILLSSWFWPYLTLLLQLFQAAALGASATVLRGHHLEVAFDAGDSCMFAMKLQGLTKIQDGFTAVIDYNKPVKHSGTTR